jgi:hypothetical protein
MKITLILLSIFFILTPGARADPGYTSLNLFEYTDPGIESRYYFNGANHIFITAYGNYTFYFPDMIMKFEDYQGNEVIQESIFIPQYLDSGYWEALQDYFDPQGGDPVVTKVNDTYFQVDYNIYDKKTVIATGRLIFDSFTLQGPPKITQVLNKTQDWNKGSMRWIWDLIPGNDFKNIVNESARTVINIDTIQGLKKFNNNTKKLRLEKTDQFTAIIDVSDFNNSLSWYAGTDPNWNSKGIVTIFPINETNIDPIVYTESAPTALSETGWNNGTWTLDVDAGSAPAGSVAEFILVNFNQANYETVGVRNTSSTQFRSSALNEAEGGGVTTVRMLTQVDGSGNIDVLSSWTPETAHYLVGYWTGISFIEDDEGPYQVTSEQDDAWYEVQTGLRIQPNRTHLIMIGNDDRGIEYLGGVRNTSSTINRYFDIMEAETNGEQFLTMFVRGDSNGYIDVYSEQYNDISFWNLGSFNTSIDFKEDFKIFYSVQNNVWLERNETLDFTPFPIDSYLDIICFNLIPTAQYYAGVREAGSSVERKFELKEPESGGYSGYGMTVKSNDTGFIGYLAQGDGSIIWRTAYYYAGYFEIPAPVYDPLILDPDLLHGTGINATPGYIIIRWSHNTSGIVDNFEVQNSSDGITFYFLGTSPTNNFTHTGPVNGSYQYYRVRSTHFNTTWFNSSWSNINLERVYFLAGSGGGVGVASIALGIILLLVGLLFGKGANI